MGVIYLDPLIGMDDAGSESDGGNVAFPGGAQAENEPQGAGREAGLVGVRNDRWIEQGSGFQGVFGEEIGADQEPSRFGQFRVRCQRLAHLFEAFQKELADVLVPLRRNPRRRSSRSGPTRSSGSDMIRAMILATRSGPPGVKGRRRTRDWSGLRIVDVRLRCMDMGVGGYSAIAIGCLKLVRMFCASRISARESRKARVDSAPWFPLTRSTCSPSRQPPVSGE